MIIQSIDVERFRAMEDVVLKIGRHLTAIAGRNATMKSTLLGMLGQPFSISNGSPMYGELTIDGYNFRSQFKEKFRLSKEHDIAGQHKWILKFCNSSYYHNNYIQMVSVARKAKGQEDSIRFINSEGKSKGKGYVQLPVVYLSLSRIYPIGETGKTRTMDINLSEDEKSLYVSWYKDILSISEVNNAQINIERKDSRQVFAGLSDDIHDVFTSSAGEGNIGRIIIAVLSFKKLKEKYGSKYKGGILLIDELDATLYGYSQIKLVRFLKKIASEYRIQVIFTTHSPLILKEVNRFQRLELKDKNIPLTFKEYDFDCEIIDLKPKYDNGIRKIIGANIHSSNELKEAINDINLKPTSISQSINVYLEDNRALSLLLYILERGGIEASQYINPVDINLGWTNYLQLYEKEIPEFRNSLIILDNDVKSKPNFKAKKHIVMDANNILFMPVDVEAGIYKMLRNHENYSMFEAKLKEKHIAMSYDVCFRDYVNDECSDSNEYKQWFKYVEQSIKDVNLLFDVWYTIYREDAIDFIEEFINTYNVLAEEQELDYLIPSSFDNLDDTINSDTKVENKPKIGRLF